jgi:hypothetical protein
MQTQNALFVTHSVMDAILHPQTVPPVLTPLIENLLIIPKIQEPKPANALQEKFKSEQTA